MIVERLSSASIILSRKLFGLLDPEDEGTSALRNIGNYTPDNTQRHITDKLNLLMQIVPSAIGHA